MNPFGIFLRGMAMGVAELIPGVSGGTIALVTGVYERLVHALRSADLEALGFLLRGRIASAWQHVDASFLLLLVAGMATSVLVLASVLHALLQRAPVVVWAFFLGLMLAAFVLMLVDALQRHSTLRLALLFAGAGLGLLVVLSPAIALPAGPLGFLVAGAIAICAWILPGVSGSYLLVLMGLYVPVIGAIHERDLLTLLPFAVGAGLGLLLFVRLLDWALARAHDEVLALMTGFVGAAALGLWPWRAAPEHCDSVTGWLSPGEYANHCGSPLVVPALGALVVGIAVMLVLNRLGRVDGDGR